MTVILTLAFSEPTPSVNRLHGRHWGRKVKMRKRWGWLTRAALSEARRSAFLGGENRALLSPDLWPLPHATVRVVRHGARLLDPDNATGGTKWLLDSLVHEGILTDDKPAHLTLLPVEQHIGEPYRTMVIVEVP